MAMLNTVPYPANQVSVQPPLSQMRVGALAWIVVCSLIPARSLPVPAQTLVARSAQYGLRSSRLRILPEPVFGNSSIHEIERGTL